MITDTNKTKAVLKKLLADYLGIESEDINDEDFLREDLHMSSTDITDFFHILEKKFDYTFGDLTSIETFQDVVEEISENAEL